MQANYRLPASLLNDLKKISEENNISQTVIVRDAVQEKIAKIKSQIQRPKEDRQIGRETL